MPTYGWLLDAKRCIECRACEAACKQWNGVDTGTGVRWRQVRVFEKGAFPAVATQALSLACNHCDRPLCLMACPVKAYYRRRDGVIILDQTKCVGCRYCLKWCPYGAPQFNPRTGKMEKCTMCADRIDAGLEPACASACPTGALRWGKWEEIASQGVDQVENFSTPVTTRPAIRFITERWKSRDTEARTWY
jgi:DMSO reductase iron-sulfur subunit